jgi:hypothetical protein
MIVYDNTFVHPSMGVDVVPAIRLLEIRIRWQVREILLNLFLHFYKSGGPQQYRRKATRHGAIEPTYSLALPLSHPVPHLCSCPASSPPLPSFSPAVAAWADAATAAAWADAAGFPGYCPSS